LWRAENTFYFIISGVQVSNRGGEKKKKGEKKKRSGGGDNGEKGGELV